MLMMGLPANATPLLDLPLELREQIYKEVLISQAKSFDLLRTCREIHNGAHKFLYQRPLVFRSQLCLYQWSRSTIEENCSRVTEISLTLQDVDLRTILRSQLTNDITASPPRLLTWELYEMELAKLHETLRRLPRIETFTLRALDLQSFLYHAFLFKVLDLLSSVCPVLKDFRVESSIMHHNLGILADFQTLRHLTFAGISAWSASETARILNRMEQLESLSFISNQAATMPLYVPGDGFLKQEKLRDNGCKGTQDWKDPPSSPKTNSISSRPSNLTAKILALLHDYGTLDNISILHVQKPHDEPLVALQKIVNKAAIATLELNGPSLQLETLKRYHLLEHVATFRIRIKSAADASDILHYLWTQQSEGGLTKLRRLVLTRNSGNMPKGVLWTSEDSGIEISTDADHVVSPSPCGRF